MVFDRLLQLWRQCVYVCLSWRFDSKVDQRRQQLLEISGRHLRNIFREDQRKRTSRIIGPLFLMVWNHPASAAYLNVVVPMSLLLGAAVYVENNFAVFNDDVCDLQFVAGFGGRPVSRNLHGDRLIIGRDLPGAHQL